MNYILILAAVFCIAALLGTLEFVRYSRSKRIADEQLTAMHRIQKDVHALCAGAINMGKHVDALEQRIRRLAERQDQWELRDPLEQTYAHAIRLAQKGVDVNELVENCGLARGEAELLLRVHRVQQSQVAAAE
jgi:hypothetical protein